MLFYRTKNQIKRSQKLVEKIHYLDGYLLAQGFKLSEVINVSEDDLTKILKGETFITVAEIKQVDAFFTNISLADLLDDRVILSPYEKISFSKRTIKLRYLNEYLSIQYGLTLARALGISDKKIKNILCGQKQPSKSLCHKAAAYFLLPTKYLTDNSLELPNYESLQTDPDIVNIQKKDLKNGFELFKQKHYFSRNYRVLSFSLKIKLFFSSCLVLIPLLAYTGYCAFNVTSEKIATVDKYREGSDESEIYDTASKTQVDYHDDLYTTSKEHFDAETGNNPQDRPYYVDVKVGTKLEKIKNIDSKASSYEARLQVFFEFDKDEFKNMFYKYASTALWGKILNEYYANEGSGEPIESRATNFSDFINHAIYSNEHQEFFENWVSLNDEKYYPGETPSNVLTDKETMFDVGNGEFVADSYGTINSLEEITAVDDQGISHTTCYQKVKFNAAIEKAFDSARYPLDSVQFKIYILPIMDTQYIRYVPNRDVNEEGDKISGFTPFFGITNGYRLIKENDSIKNFTLRTYYYKDVNNDPAVDYPNTYRTELEICVRANRAGVSLFLQAFINLFSVVIWITIGFYNQSHNSEDSIGMLGTGLFGVISSMLVGLAMVSDAGIFSLITMINIFTLAVIMIMTYQSISAKRAQVQKNNVMIAYNGIKLRIMFYLLTFCTVMMFIGLPLLSYIFTL